MNRIINTLYVVVVFAGVALSQVESRDQKIQDLRDLRVRMAELEKDVLKPTVKDSALAREEGANALRLMPREKYENAFTLRGGGAYYSFVRGTHEYGYGSDIELQKDQLSVGFAGADYGFIIDIGNAGLTEVRKDLPGVHFLASYVPPQEEPAIRAEQKKSHSYEANGFVYKRSLPAVVGHTYVLRSISFDDSDILVAFSVRRKDTDGSLIIFWRKIESFEKPEIARSSARIQP